MGTHIVLIGQSNFGGGIDENGFSGLIIALSWGLWCLWIYAAKLHHFGHFHVVGSMTCVKSGYSGTEGLAQVGSVSDFSSHKMRVIHTIYVSPKVQRWSPTSCTRKCMWLGCFIVMFDRCGTTNLGTSCHCEQRLGQRRACWDNFCHRNVNIFTWMCSSRIYVYIYISIFIYTTLCNHRRGPISQVLGVFSSHGYLRSQVHAAIENVGLKEVWLKIAGGEKAMLHGLKKQHLRVGFHGDLWWCIGMSLECNGISTSKHGDYVEIMEV